jgi:hypothetical protein
VLCVVCCVYHWNALAAGSAECERRRSRCSATHSSVETLKLMQYNREAHWGRTQQAQRVALLLPLSCSSSSSSSSNVLGRTCVCGSSSSSASAVNFDGLQESGRAGDLKGTEGRCASRTHS